MYRIVNHILLIHRRCPEEKPGQVCKWQNKILYLFPLIKTNLDTILKFREYIYDLLVHCVDPLQVLKQVFHHLLKAIPDEYFKFKYEVIKSADYYENTLKIGSKPIYHLEGYIINLFRIVKNLQKQMNKDIKKNKSK